MVDGMAEHIALAEHPFVAGEEVALLVSTYYYSLSSDISFVSVRTCVQCAVAMFVRCSDTISLSLLLLLL